MEDELLERLASIIATIMKNEDHNRALAEEYQKIRKHISDVVKASNEDAVEASKKETC